MFWNHFFIVGTQKDRRDEEEQDMQVSKLQVASCKLASCKIWERERYESKRARYATTKMGKRMADELKLSKFIETSALKDQQVIVIFEAYFMLLSKLNKSYKSVNMFLMWIEFVVGTKRSIWSCC